MGLFKKRSPLEKEYEKVLKEEQKHLLKNQKERESFLNKMLADKIPEKLQNTLDTAFSKAFRLIFTKGAGAIEFTYNKEKLEQDYKLRDFAGEIKKDRKSIKAFHKKAKQQDGLSLVASGISGAGMGLLGIGLPDIPVFTGMMLRDIYATSINYGFSYDNAKERYFILLLIEGAISYGERLCEIDAEINRFIETNELPEFYAEDAAIDRTARALSKALLYMKFLQGIPLVGVVGGFYDAVYMKYVASYSTLKYKRRYLYNKKKDALQ